MIEYFPEEEQKNFKEIKIDNNKKKDDSDNEEMKVEEYDDDPKSLPEI